MQVNPKNGKYFFIKIPYVKGGCPGECIAFVLYSGTNRKQKMIYSMTSGCDSCHELPLADAPAADMLLACARREVPAG